MSQALSTETQLLTFEDYLRRDDGTDTRYELVHGVPNSPSTVWYLSGSFAEGEEATMMLGHGGQTRPSAVFFAMLQEDGILQGRALDYTDGEAP